MSDTVHSRVIGLPMPMVGFELATATTRASLRAMSEWNREVARFVGHRLEEDARLQEELSRCTQPLETVEAFTRFMNMAIADYASEAKTLQEAASSVATESMAAMEAELSPERSVPIE